MKISLRACALSLLCASPVAIAGFTVIDDGKAPRATSVEAGVPGDDAAALRAELDRVSAELAATKARLSDAYRRQERTRELLNDYVQNATPPMTLGFGFGSAKFSPGSRAQECTLLVNALRSDQIDVVGFADSLGTPDANARVAARRAEAAKSYLVANGVPAQKISADGRQGEYIADNGTEAGRAANRRVEFRFTSAATEVASNSAEGKRKDAAAL